MLSVVKEMKSEPAEGAGIDRVLHLLETTDSERGGLLRRLLGDDSAESAPWHVGTAPGHLHLSRDAHWMFDRGLWTITPGFAISVAEAPEKPAPLANPSAKPCKPTK